MALVELFERSGDRPARDLMDLWRAEYAGHKFVTAVATGLWAPGLCLLGASAVGVDVGRTAFALFATAISALVAASAMRRVRWRWAVGMSALIGLSASLASGVAGRDAETAAGIGCVVGIVFAAVWATATQRLARRHSWDLDGESVLED